MNGATVLTGSRVRPLADGSTRIEAVLEDRWRIVYAQGGAVMAATIEGAMAAEGLADRAGLGLVSASTTFHQPVPCGPVVLDATPVRISRSSAQVQVTITAAGDGAERSVGPGATTTVVLAAEQPGWPDLTAAPRPPALAGRPGEALRRLGALGADGVNTFPFFDETEWREAPAGAAEPLVWHGWCRRASSGPGSVEAAPWSAPRLAVPADALGCSVVPSVRVADAAVFAISMQMSLHVLGPAVGPWLGLESRGLHVAAGIATGLHHALGRGRCARGGLHPERAAPRDARRRGLTTRGR